MSATEATGPDRCMTPPRERPPGLLTTVSPDGRHHTIVMRLYCWQHKANHSFSIAAVEKIVYALGADIARVWWAAPADPELAAEMEKHGPPCLLETLDEAISADVYAEHVEQGITARAAAGEWTA